MSVIIQSAKNFVPLSPDADHIKMLLREIDECLYVVTSKGNIINLSEYNSEFYKIPVDEVFADNISEESILLDLNHEIGYRCLILSSGNIFEITVDENNNKYWIKEPLQASGCMLFIKDGNMLESYYLYNGQTWDRINHNITGMHLTDFNNPHRVTAFQVGLGYVKNILQATQEEFDIHVSTSNIHRVNKSYIGFPNVPNILQCTFEEYLVHVETGQNLNPHKYDKESVGLENVDNYLQASVEDFEEHIVKENNPHRVTLVQIGLDRILNVAHESNDNLLAHTKNKNNPHRTNQSQISDLENIINIIHASKDDFDVHINNHTAHSINKEQIGLGNVINELQVTKVDFQKHTTNKNNPHKVTKSDIGLENVINEKQAKKSDLDNHMSIDNPHGVTKRILGLSLVENFYQVSVKELRDHVADIRNPHRITKSDIGLGNVPNIVQASGVDVGNHMNETGNPHKVTKSYIGLGNVENKKQISMESFQEHTEFSRNPHGVTKEDIGLGNVENTSDLGKIISDAQLVELNTLQDKSVNGVNIVSEKTEGDIKFSINGSVINTVNERYLQYYGMVNSLGVITNSPFNDEYVDNNTGLPKILTINYLADNYKDFQSSVPNNCLPYLYIAEDLYLRFMDYELRAKDMIIFESNNIRIKINNQATNSSSITNSLVHLSKDESLQVVDNPDSIIKILSLLKYNTQKYPDFKIIYDNSRQGNNIFMKYADYYNKNQHKNILFDFSSIKETNNYGITGITGKINNLYWSETPNGSVNCLDENIKKTIINDSVNDEFSIIEKVIDDANKKFVGQIGCNGMINAIMYKSNDGSSPIHDGDFVLENGYTLDSTIIYDFDNNKIKIILSNSQLFGYSTGETEDVNKIYFAPCYKDPDSNKLIVKLKNDNTNCLVITENSDIISDYVEFSFEAFAFPTSYDNNHLTLKNKPYEVYFTNASISVIMDNQNSELFDNCGNKRVVIHPLYYKLFDSEFGNLSCKFYESWESTSYKYDVIFNIKGKGLIRYNNIISQNNPITVNFVDKVANAATYFDYTIPSRPLSFSCIVDYNGNDVTSYRFNYELFNAHNSKKVIKNRYFTTIHDCIEIETYYNNEQNSGRFVRAFTGKDMSSLPNFSVEFTRYNYGDVKTILILPEIEDGNNGYRIICLRHDGSLAMYSKTSMREIAETLPDSSSKVIAISYVSNGSLIIYKENGSLINYNILSQTSQIIDRSILEGEKIFYMKSYINFVLFLSYDPDSEDNSVTISYYDILTSKIVNTHQKFNFGKDKSNIRSFLSKGKKTGYLDNHKIGNYIDIVGDSYGISIPINNYNGYFFQDMIISDKSVCYMNCSNNISGNGKIYPINKLANYGDIDNESCNFFNNVLENLMILVE